VHGVDQHQTFLDTAFPEAVFHLRCDVEERSPAGDLKPQFSAKRLHPAIVALVQAVDSLVSYKMSLERGAVSHTR
jgi:hypothetical protein